MTIEEWLNNLSSLGETLSKAGHSLTINTLYPPGFEQQPPAYQLAWIDQKIPRLEADLAHQKSLPPSPSLVSLKKDLDPILPNLADAFSEMEQLPAGMMEDQLTDLRARKAMLLAAMPQQQLSSAPAASKPSRQQLLAQFQVELSDIHKQKADMLANLQKIPNIDKTTLVAVERNFDDQIQKVLDAMSKI